MVRIAVGRTRMSRRRKAVRVLTFVVLAVALATLGAGVFVWASDVADREPRTPAIADRAATLAEAEEALTAAAAALERDDRRAWRKAVPSAGREAREATRELFRRLSPLPWSGVAVDVKPIDGRPGRFDVHFTGSLGAAGPPDRVMADRVLDLWRTGPSTVVVGDATPAVVERQYFMAFNRPVVVKGERCLVVADRSWRARAAQLAEASSVAHDRLEVLGLHPSRTTLIVVYGWRGQLDKARGAPFPDDRVKYFSVPAARLADDAWWPRDIGVLAPALADAGDWAPLMLAHELTHAYTMRWFDDTEHRPPLLVEGLAVAVEGGRSYESLRRELADGNRGLPLVTALSTGNLWMGSDIERVRLGYVMGGSIVLYVLDGWGLPTLRDFLRDVADSDLTRHGVDVAMRSSLGVGWDEFVAGWTGFVQTLP
jgi:hypothetical protein